MSRSPEWIEATAETDDGEEVGSASGVVHYDAQNVRNWAEMQKIDQAVLDELEPLEDLLPIGIMKNMYVDEDYRNEGYGNELMSSLMEAATDLGAKTLLLEADIGDESNVIDLEAWFEGFGFETVGYSNGYPIMILR